jgi:CubicO group peptidase (beta-lactamase class C family)/fucose 4-O-acetylase-like acetyltransferase
LVHEFPGGCADALGDDQSDRIGALTTSITGAVLPTAPGTRRQPADGGRQTRAAFRHTAPAPAPAPAVEGVPVVEREAQAPRQAEREVFLDAVRTLAIFRVVLWHALGAAVLTYFVAAVPAMFFVTGSLLAKSLRRGARRTILDRARRILLPLWVFAAGAYAAMTVAHLVDRTSNTSVPWHNLVFWLLPLDDPHGSSWEGGYMSSPLWYLRALLWLFLLSPLLLRLVHWSVPVAITLPLAALGVLEVLDRTGRWPVTSSLAWRVGDLALYSTFLMLGFVHRDGRFNNMARRHWLAVTLVLGAGAAFWCTTQPVSEHVVNNSHIAHLLVGGAWLSLFFVARPWIEWVARTRPGGALISWVNKRTITIYLWHSTAVLISFELLRSVVPHWFPGGWSAALLALTACVTLVFVLLFGWVEDIANKRPRKLWAAAGSIAGLWSLPWPAVGAAVMGSVVLVASADQSALLSSRMSTLSASEAIAAPIGTAPVGATSTTASAGSTSSTTTAKGATLRIPSQQPKAPSFTNTAAGPVTTAGGPGTTAQAAPTSTAGPAATTTTPSTMSPPSTVPSTTTTAGTIPPVINQGLSSIDQALAARLENTLRQWMADNQVPGAEVAMYRPGSIDWATALGVDPIDDNQPVTVGTRFDIASVTKTFTATLIWQLADQGRLNVDAPIGRLAAAPDFPYTQITPRQLLSHTSGLTDFRSTPEFSANADNVDSPAKALSAAGHQPLQFAPGSESTYSTTNYLVLGFLIEQITGQSYDSLVGELADQAGIGQIPHAAPAAGYPNFSVAGLETTVSQLAHWGVALLGDNTPGLSDGARQAMADINPNSALGAGLWGYCPCTMVDGQPQWSAIGHTGSNTELQYSPATNIAIVMNVTDSAWAPGNRQDQLIALATQLRAIALGQA